MSSVMMPASPVRRICVVDHDVISRGRQVVLTSPMLLRALNRLRRIGGSGRSAIGGGCCGRAGGSLWLLGAPATMIVTCRRSVFALGHRDDAEIAGGARRGAEQVLMMAVVVVLIGGLGRDWQRGQGGRARGVLQREIAALDLDHVKADAVMLGQQLGSVQFHQGRLKFQGVHCIYFLLYCLYLAKERP